MKSDIMQATLRLFHALTIPEASSTPTTEEMVMSVMSQTIPHGYVLDPRIPADKETLAAIQNVVGISGEEANASFHKSWNVVRDTPMQILFVQQIAHYITTYGFESLGVYSEDTVYVPSEVLKIPVTSPNIPLTVIRALTPNEVLERIVALGGSGVALSETTLADIMTIVRANMYPPDYISNINNHELKMLLYDFYGIAPKEPVDFLRYIIMKTTGKTLLIKNDALIAKIESADAKVLDAILANAPDDLASIFFRFKPLFLAMKHASNNKTFFNRLRKRANKIHKPMKPSYLNTVTYQIKRNMLSVNELRQQLKTARVFRKVRLAQALQFRLTGSSDVVYRIRNGRGWATDFKWDGDADTTKEALNVVLDSIGEDLAPQVAGKTFYIPPYMQYALPATQKQFVGNFPSGTHVSVPQDLIVGIHWVNTDNKRVDLDLSLVNEHGKVGWDCEYRTPTQTVLFSGDMTSAPPPNGATEAFAIRNTDISPHLVYINYYNFNRGDKVPAKLFVANVCVDKFPSHYMVNPNDIMASTVVQIRTTSDVVGLIMNGSMYFMKVSISKSITSRNSSVALKAKRFLAKSANSFINLTQSLQRAGAIVTNEQPDTDEYIDLSPTMMNKSTILDLMV